MRSCLLALLVLATPAFAQQSAPKLSFTPDPNFPQMPEGMNFGEVPGVAVNSKGNVFVFSRSSNVTGVAFGPSAAQLFEFTSDGKFSAMQGILNGTYKVDSDKLCLKGDDGIETCTVYPKGKKSGDTFEVEMPQGKTSVKIN